MIITEGFLIVNNLDAIQGVSQSFVDRISPNLNSKYIWVESIVIEHQYYNIGPYTNQFFFQVLNMPNPPIDTALLTDDEYDLNQLSAEFNATFLFDGIFLMVNPTANGHIAIQNNYLTNVVIRFDLMPDLAYIMGWTPIQIIINPGTQELSPYPTDFNPFPILFIEATGLIPSASYFGVNPINNIIAIIPVNAAFGETITFKQDHPRYFKINPNVSSFSIRILDDKRREINLNNGKAILTFNFGHQQELE